MQMWIDIVSQSQLNIKSNQLSLCRDVTILTNIQSPNSKTCFIDHITA